MNYKPLRTRNTKGICRSCGGSGYKLRPTKAKLLSFILCSCCKGRGVRFKAE